MKRIWWRSLLPGILLGFTVGRLGFADYNELHRMLLFRDLRLLLAFALAVSLSILLFALLRGRLKLAPVPFHRGLVPGAALFGVGWAVTGVCPGVALVQLGQGIGWAAITLAGILTGIWIQSRFQRRSVSPPAAC